METKDGALRRLLIDSYCITLCRNVQGLGEPLALPQEGTSRPAGLSPRILRLRCTLQSETFTSIAANFPAGGIPVYESSVHGTKGPIHSTYSPYAPEQVCSSLVLQMIVLVTDEVLCTPVWWALQGLPTDGTPHHE